MANNRSYSQWRMREGREPLPDESLDGYIAHRAAEEDIPTTLIITSLGGAPFGHRRGLTLSGEGIDAVADCLRADAADLASRTHPIDPEDANRRMFFGASLDRAMLDACTRWFSPSSLAASPHHRALWTLRFLPFCVDSWEILTDRCPAVGCGAVQRWHRAAGVDRCDQCVESLTRAEAALVPEALRPSLRNLAHLLHPDPAKRSASLEILPRVVQNLGVGAIADLACALAGAVDPSLRAARDRRVISKRADPQQVCAAMAEAWRLLAGWPQSVERLMATRLATRQSRFGDGNGGGSLDFLATASSPRTPAQLKRLIAALRVMLESNASEGVDLKEAAAKVGVPVMRMAELRRSGELPTIFYLEGDRPQPLLCRKAVESLAEARRSSLSLQKAAVQLGTSVHGIEQMLCLELLDGVELAEVGPGSESPRVASASVQLLLRRLELGSTNDLGDGVAISEAVKPWPGQKPWGSIFDTLLRGDVAFTLVPGSAPVAHRMLVEERAAAALSELRFDKAAYPLFPFAPVMSKKDATDALNLHARDAIPLLAQWDTSTTKKATVPVAAIEALCAQCISTAELGWRLSMGPQRANNWAERVGLPRVSPAGFERSSFAKVLAERRS